MGATGDLTLTKPLAEIALLFGVLFSVLLVRLLVQMTREHLWWRRAKLRYKEALNDAFDSVRNSDSTSV